MGKKDKIDYFELIYLLIIYYEKFVKVWYYVNLYDLLDKLYYEWREIY